MRFRLLNKIYAHIFGYFWAQCSLCGKYFGGHEWKQDNQLMITKDMGECVCNDCGDKARKINKKELVIPDNPYYSKNL